MWRSLWHYRRINAAVLVAVAVAAAVLSGALMVGDSVRASLRDLTLQRLGGIDHVLITDHLLPERLAQALRDDDAFDGEVTGVMLLQGSVSAGEGARASGVQITGLDASFTPFFPQAEAVMAALPRASGQFFPSGVINQTLADELGVAEGDEIVLAFENISDIHRDSLYGRKNSEDVIDRLRVTVRGVIEDAGMGRFGLAAGQQIPRNVYVEKTQLQRVLDADEEVNALFFSGVGDVLLPTEPLEAALRRQARLADLNVEVRQAETYFSLETPSFFLNPDLATTAEQVAQDMGLTTLPVSTYLVNRIEANETITPYSLIAAVDLPSDLAEVMVEGKAELNEDELLLNAWTAEDLGVGVGDSVTLHYYEVSIGDALTETSITFTVAGVLAMEGFALDRDMAPDFPGIEDTDNMADWDPPFTMDMSLIRPKDEDYWDDYRTAGKVMVSLAAGRQMWDSRFGFYTNLRMAPRDGETVAETAAAFVSRLETEMDVVASGLAPLAVKEQGLNASAGSTDFSSLFIALSFFIIISAALLMGLFFRLSVAQRRSEIGVLMTGGYTVGKVRGRFLREGMVIALLGAGLGVAGGVGYGLAIMAGLRNLWDLGTTNLHFYFVPTSAVIGALSAVIVALISIWGGVRAIGKESLTRVVSGEEAAEQVTVKGKRARLVFFVFLILAVANGLGALAAGQSALFFGVGVCLVVAGLAAVAWYAASRPRDAGLENAWRMAVRNTTRHRGRTLVSVSLVASACFIITVMGLSKNDGSIDVDALDSGAGGFFLTAQADVPLYRRPNTEEAMAEYLFDEETAGRVRTADWVSLRFRGGDDASCLNLFAPTEPRVLGVPSGSLTGRFAFQALAEEAEDPWTLLDQDLSEDVVPVFVDYNSALWILKTGVGKDLTIKNGDGQDVTLRVVGMLKKGIFQSEILISENQFLKLFPDQGGYGFFLIGSDEAQRDTLAATLEEALSEYGFDAESTVAKMTAFHEIENTYISIFQMLGGLGLLLGTVGLGAIIYRNAMERRGEFAGMRAFGYRRRLITLLLLRENAVLLVWGVLIGAGSAVVATAPYLFETSTTPSYLAVVITLAGVALVGMTASIWAVREVAKLPILASLRAK